MHDLSIGFRDAFRKPDVANVDNPILAAYAPQYLEVTDRACLSSAKALTLVSRPMPSLTYMVLFLALFATISIIISFDE